MASATPIPWSPPDRRGARRRKVGATGRLHLDRRLPFLVVHRLPARESAAHSLGRRIAVNSPAYLIWNEGEDDAEALRLLGRLAAELSQPGRPLLVMGLHDLAQSPESGESQHLTPFVARVAGGDSEGGQRARAQLVEAIEGIRVDLRQPDVIEQSLAADHWLADALSNEAAASDLLLLGLPQIHLRDDGGVYPQLAHELVAACGDALLRTACAYLADGHDPAPVHYRALGRSAFLTAALNADRKLAQIAASFDFLLSVSPINATEARDRFLADREEVAPDFRYRPLTVDPDSIKRRLYQLDFARLEDPLLERMFTDKRHEIDAQLTMLATRNTPAFRPAGMFLYGAVSAALLADARQVLAMPHPRLPRGETIDAPAIAAAARRLVDSYHRKDAAFEATVEVRDDVSGLMVTGNRLLVGSAATMRLARLEALLAHEVSTHLLTFVNGAAQGLSIFRTGLASYEGIQEGLGVFAEWAVGGLNMVRMRLLAARVVAVDAMQRGAEFMDTYRLVRGDLGFSAAGAFSIATRVHRSGGLAKDAIYLEGFRAIVDHLAAGGSLLPFWLGKIARTDVPAVEELLQRGLVHPPIFLPHYLERSEARQRLARLQGEVALEQLLQNRID